MASFDSDTANTTARRWANTTNQGNVVLNSSSPETATASAIGWGYRNTRAILLQGNTDTTTSAAALADAYTVTVSGVTYDDWYLPSTDELNQMCKWARGITGVNLTNLAQACTGGALNTGPGAAGFTAYYYWSSSESANSLARMQNFADGAPLSTYKYNVVHIRPIRAF